VAGSAKTGLDMTPMINASLIILVSMMIISAQLTQTSLKVKLPRASTKERGEEQTIMVTYTLNHRIAIGDNEVKLEGFYEALERAIKCSPGFIIVINADRSLPYGEVEELIDITRQAGAARLAIATEEKRDD